MAVQRKEKSLTEEKFYIDKTEELEQALKEYLCVYVEGAASSGKSTSIRMACGKHENLPVLFVSAGREKPEKYSERIRRFREEEGDGKRWIVVENLPGVLTEGESGFFLSLLEQLNPEERLILESREEIPEALLDPLWKGRIQLVVQPSLTREEVIRLAAERDSFLNPSEVYEATGGWAGCVDLLLRLTAHPRVRMGTNNISISQVLQRNEVKCYLETEILQTLRPSEQELLREMELCPWMHPDLCREVFEIPDVGTVFETLQRKGILIRCHKNRLWKRVALFENIFSGMEEKERNDSGVILKNSETTSGSGCFGETEKLRAAGKWFDENGFVGQALYCLEKIGDREGYQECLRAHYTEIPFSGIALSGELLPEDSSPQSCYLRGMEAVNHHDWAVLEKEIRTIGKPDTKQAAEICLNLTFADPLIPLESWMKQLKQTAKVYGPLQLYHILGGSYTFLCGLRDLSELFVGGRKTERKNAEFWRSCLDSDTWKAYQFARMEFYLETKQRDKLPEEDWRLLLSVDPEDAWTFLFARYWLLIKIRRSPDVEERFHEEREDTEHSVRELLAQEENIVCQRLLEAADALRTNGGGEKILFSWLREKRAEWSDEIREDTVGTWFLRSVACYEIQQYDRVDKILKKMVPFARSGRRSRILAECLFQQAAINWYRGNRKKSLQDVVESFLVTGESHYVKFYTCCGRNGYEVLEEYMEWLSSNSPDTWSRKKKYKYGNVLNMPLEDYMNTVLREAKKTRGQAAKRSSEENEEALTVTEIIVLKELSTGMTNEEICADLNLKLTTVKGHIYSIYKKLGVKSRVQALLMGKERGLLREE